MSHHRVRIVLIAFTAAILAMFAVTLVLCHDAPPLDDSFIRLERLNVPAEDNAFTWLERAGDGLEIDSYYDFLATALEDETSARRVIEQNVNAFDNLAAALRCPQFEVPAMGGYGTLLPYIDSWGKIRNLARLRAALLLSDGKHREALGQFMQLVEFGHRVQNCRGAIIHYSVGLRIKNYGLAGIRAMLANAPLSRYALRETTGRLARFAADPDAVENALKVEYGTLAATIDDLAAGRFRAELNQMMDISLPFTPYNFQPNKTKQLIAGVCMLGVVEASKAYAEQAIQGMPPMVPALRSMPPLRRYRTRNFTGTIVWGMVTYEVEALLRLKCEENTAVAGTRLLIALKCYREATGHLPDSLDELAPDHIDQVPRDDFDGKPFRYLPDRKIIYSVGLDIVDDGGKECDHNTGKGDTIWEIKF